MVVNYQDVQRLVIVTQVGLFDCVFFCFFLFFFFLVDVKLVAIHVPYFYFFV